MAFNGIEIDMLSLGNADSLLVTRWEDDEPTYVLIDAGYAADARIVARFLRRRGVHTIDHLVCSHLHDDHAEGLVTLVREAEFDIGTAWVHDPSAYVDMHEVHRALTATARLSESRLITNSLKTQQNLIAELEDRGIEVVAPFRNQWIGFLRVHGPSEKYYQQLVQQFDKIDSLRQLQEAANARDLGLELNEAFKRKAAAELPADAVPYTDPENRASTILSAAFDDKVMLLTADAGVESLRRVRNDPGLAGCCWMQVPHHGSINNINQNLVDHFSPTRAFVSAAGNRHHPHPAVVAGFKKAGTRVFGTHARGRHLWFKIGSVPDRSGYTRAEPL